MKVGDVLKFGEYNWFKADNEGAFIAVCDIGQYAYGESMRDGDGYTAPTLLLSWLNSADETFDISQHVRNTTSWSWNTYRDHRSGFLYEFDPDEQMAVVGDVTIPSISDIWGDNRLPLFKKMGIRVKGPYGRYREYWLKHDTTDGEIQHWPWCPPVVGANGQQQNYGGTSPIRVRPMIHLDPDMTVIQTSRGLTPYSNQEKLVYEIDYSNIVVDTITYTEEDFASLFELA